MKCTQQEVEESARAAHSDPNREVPFGESHHQIPAPEAEIPFDLSDFKFEEIRSVVRKAHTGTTNSIGQLRRRKQLPPA